MDLMKKQATKRPPKPPSARKKLTLKQRPFIGNKLQGQFDAQALRDAWFRQSVTRKARRIIGRRSWVKTAFSEILHEAGVRDKRDTPRTQEKERHSGARNSCWEICHHNASG